MHTLTRSLALETPRMQLHSFWASAGWLDVSEIQDENIHKPQTRLQHCLAPTAFSVIV